MLGRKVVCAPIYCKFGVKYKEWFWFGFDDIWL